jgi:signal transduction histidine kinase
VKHSTRLIIILMLTTIGLMSIFVGVRYIITVSDFDKNLVTKANTIAYRVANSVKPAIWNIYKNTVEKKYSQDLVGSIIDSEFLDPQVLGIVIYGDFGNVFVAQYKDENNKIKNYIPQIGDYVENNAIKQKTLKIKDGPMTIGNVRIYLTNKQNEEHIRGVLWFDILQTIFVSIFFVVFLFYALRRALIQPAKELAIANSELEEFTYRISHDLRSPVISSISLLKEVEFSIKKGEIDESLECISYLGDSLEQLDKLIRDILNILSVKNKKETSEVINLDETIDNTISLFSSLDGIKHIKIIKDLQHTCTIKSKPSRVRMIIQNLTSNAIKYQNFNIDASYLKFKTYNDDKTFTLEVEDNGLGIPEEQKSKIFGMFTRFHPKVSFGTGLGLYLIKKSIDFIGAEIEFVPKEQGVKFIIKMNIGDNKSAR